MICLARLDGLEWHLFENNMDNLFLFCYFLCTTYIEIRLALQKATAWWRFCSSCSTRQQTQAGFCLLTFSQILPPVLSLRFSSLFSSFFVHSLDHSHKMHLYIIIRRGPSPTGYFVFCRLYPFSPSHHGSVWLLPVISLLLTNTVSRMRACLSKRLERFRGSQKEDENRPLSKLFIYVLLHLLIACCSVLRPLRGADPRFELGPALRQAVALTTELSAVSLSLGR